MRSYPKLYRSDETNFAHNGLGVLKDCILCEVIEERNGKFELELTYKVGSFLCEQLKEDNIIKSNANPKLFNQKFRIYKTIKQLDGNIKIYAQHISYDLATDIVETVTVNGNCQMALQSIFDNSQLSKHYVGKSNIGMTSNFHLEFVNCLEAIAGVKGSILDTFGNGAEILRDNEIIRIEQNRGRDSNILISYKKNLTGLNAEVDWSNMCTRLFPYAKVQGSTVDKSEEIITLDEKFIDSGFINNYSKPFIKFMEFTGVSNKDELKVKALNYMNNTASDTPKVNYTINFVPLSKTVEYKDYALLEDIDLCDTVIVRDSRYGIDIKLKCIAYKYNPLTGRCNSIILGSPKTSLAAATAGKDDSKDNIQNTSNDWDKILQDAIKDMTDKITGNQGGHVVLYPPENPAELFFMDTPNVNTSKTVLRINKSGIGFSKTGVNGPYLTGWDLDGNFLADCITTGTLNANLIKAGILSSFNNLFSINMETGSFRFNNSVVDFHDNGLKISMADGVGAQGYTNIAYDGLGIYDSNNNRKAWFGSGDSAYINTLNADNINNRHLIKWSENRPTDLYISPNATGDGTGRDTNNKSNSINHTLDWIKQTYGCYSYKKNLNIHVDNGSYYEDIYIGGWIGSGVIQIFFDNNATFYGNHRIEENTMYIYFNGRRWNDGQWTNEGCLFVKRNAEEALFHVRNSNCHIYNLRALKEGWDGDTSTWNGYGFTFVYATSGASVFCYNNDVVGFYYFSRSNDNSEISIYNNRGHNFTLAQMNLGGTIKCQGYIPLYHTGAVQGEASDWIDKGNTTHNSMFQAKPTPEEPPVVPPSTSWQWFEQSFNLNNLRTRPEGSGSSTSSRSGEWGQGSWGSYQSHRGYADLGDNPANWCGGGRNFAVELTLTRSNTSHGYAGAVPVPKIKLPNGTFWSCGVAFSRGQTSTVTLPGELAGAIANGSIKTLEMWAGSSNSDYSFYNYSSIKIRCEKEV